MFTKIIVGFLSFVLMIFPNWGNVRYAYLVRTNSPSIVAPKVIDAIKTKNIVALESMMCNNIKQNTSDLRGEIGKMLDAIDGDIISIERRSGGGSYSESRSNGRKISQEGFDFTITTTKQTYALGSCWETANNFNPAETGFRTLGLGIISPLESLVLIKATNGIREWHD